MVYVITDGELTKVGKAKDVEKRMKGLQTGNGRKLRAIYILDGNTYLEKEIHKKLAKFRTEVANEWFKLDKHTLDSMLGSYKTGTKQRLDLIQGAHRARLLNSKTPDVKKDYLGVKRADKRRDVKERRQELLNDLKSQIGVSKKMISYAPLVQRYGFTKAEISYFVKSSRLAKDVYLHNQSIAK